MLIRAVFACRMEAFSQDDRALRQHVVPVLVIDPVASAAVTVR